MESWMISPFLKYGLEFSLAIMRIINKLKSIKQGIQDSFQTHIIDETNNNHRYQVVKCLSSDIDGSSFLVKCDKTQQLYTCKRCINKTKQTSEYFIKKLHVEYSVTSNLDHPNIIKFYDLIKHKNEWFALTEYASDGSLFDKCKKDLSMHEIEIYFKQLIDGLDYLHTKGIAHRNIKLENLLITDNKIKISNFSHADVFRVIHDYEKRFSRGIIGSGPYVAPEIYLNERYDGEAADIWSCGIVLHAMLFRHFPFKKAHKTNTSYVRFMQNREYEGNYLSRLPNEVQSLLLGMLEPNPNKRCRLSKIKNNRWFKGITEDV